MIKSPPRVEIHRKKSGRTKGKSKTGHPWWTTRRTLKGGGVQKIRGSDNGRKFLGVIHAEGIFFGCWGKKGKKTILYYAKKKVRKKERRNRTNKKKKNSESSIGDVGK